MHRYNKILLVAFLLISAGPAAAATTTDPVIGTTTPIIIGSFCDRVDVVTEAVHADASARAAEHRADVQRIDLQREDDKKKLSEVRTEDRVQEDAAREALIAYLTARATTPEAFAAIDSFATNSAEALHELRTETDKARDMYARVSRPVSLSERAIRDKALTAYIDMLDTANALAEGQCAKGANDEKVLAQYNAWLVDAKNALAKSLSAKKSTLDQRAREAHLAELARYQKEYQRKMQTEMKLLTDKLPELFAGMDESATSTPATATDTPETATDTVDAQ
jgi:hypothetical protein